MVIMPSVAALGRRLASPRRTAQAIVVRAFALVILTETYAAPSATAGVAWCRTDPVVVIDDQVADIFVSVRFDELKRVNGPTEIVITTPVDVDITLATPGVGFGYGENVTFEESPALEKTDKGIDLRIEVYVPAQDDIRVLVQFAPRVVGILNPRNARGEANDWIRLGKTVL